MTRTLIHGAGRMARRILARSTEFDRIEILGLVSRSRPQADPGANWYASLGELDFSVDLLIDFTLPGGTRDAAQWCAANRVALLSGTTGLAEADTGALKSAALKVPVLWAPT